MEGELRDIKYWNPTLGSWQSAVPEFPLLNYCGLQCTAVNISGENCYFFMYWYGFDSYGNRLYQHVTQTVLLAPGESITDSISFFCDLPGVYAATCQLYAWPIGESSKLVDWVGTLDIGVPIAYVTGVPEILASIDTWYLWDWESASWVRPSPTLVPLHKSIGIQGVAKNMGATALDMRLDVQTRSPDGVLQTIIGDVRNIPAGLWPYDYPWWGFLWEATESGDWEADLILRAGPNLEVIDRMDNIPVAHVALYIPPEEITGEITSVEVGTRGSWQGLPVSGVVAGDYFNFKAVGKNTSAEVLPLGLAYTITKPSGATISSFVEEAWPYTGAGKSHSFIEGSFVADEVGSWFIDLELRAQGKVLDTYSALMFDVVAETPVEPGYTLINDYLYPYAAQYVGSAEECTFTFSLTPEQVPGTAWFAEQIVNAFAEKVQEQGCQMLRLQVYEDTSPAWHTDYKVLATSTASPVPWALIIVGVLAILFLFALSYTIGQIREFLWGEEGEPPVGFGEMIMLIAPLLVIGLMMFLLPKITPKAKEGFS